MKLFPLCSFLGFVQLFFAQPNVSAESDPIITLTILYDSISQPFTLTIDADRTSTSPATMLTTVPISSSAITTSSSVQMSSIPPPTSQSSQSLALSASTALIPAAYTPSPVATGVTYSARSTTLTTTATVATFTGVANSNSVVYALWVPIGLLSWLIS